MKGCSAAGVRAGRPKRTVPSPPCVTVGGGTGYEGWLSCLGWGVRSMSREIWVVFHPEMGHVPSCKKSAVIKNIFCLRNCIEINGVTHVLSFLSLSTLYTLCVVNEGIKNLLLIILCLGHHAVHGESPVIPTLFSCWISGVPGTLLLYPNVIPEG